MASKSKLHAQVAGLFPGVKLNIKRSLMHALIDLGHIIELRCAHEHCRLDYTPFTPTGNRCDSVTFDHVVPLGRSGTDDWRNLQLMHHRCNMSKGAGFDAAYRQKISIASKRRWQDPKYRREVLAKSHAGNMKPAARKKRSKSLQVHWADPERREHHINGIRQGRRWS